jgi:hypothetical protein
MKLKAVVFGLAALAFTTGSASAMPNGIAHPEQITGQASKIEHVRWVCNPWGRCWWRPNWYGPYGYWGPRPIWGPRWYGPYAWGPRPWWGWRRWHYWG